MRITKLDMAKVIVTALYNYPKLVDENCATLWNHVKRIERKWKKEDLEYEYKLAKEIVEGRVRMENWDRTIYREFKNDFRNGKVDYVPLLDTSFGALEITGIQESFGNDWVVCGKANGGQGRSFCVCSTTSIIKGRR